MQTAVTVKKPGNTAFSGHFRAGLTYRERIKDDHKIDAAPCEYMENMKKQIAGEGVGYGSITTMEDLKANLAENCIPAEFMNMDIFDYALFLDTRRTLMAEYIKQFYFSLA